MLLILKRCLLQGFPALLILLFCGISAQAQPALAPITKTYAIPNVRIVQAPGQIIDHGTVLIRDGVIVEVGTNVTIPFDAEIIKADSMIVYAGFIDGLSNAGIPKPKEDKNQEKVKQPGNPPNDRAGIQPERDAHTMLKPSDKSVKELRELGFTLSRTVPHGRMLPGTGAIVLLAGDTPNEMVFKGNASLFAQFAGARGVYPSTIMGIMAKWRDLYKQAERRKQIEVAYTANPAGLSRPEYDPVRYAFFPVMDGTMPVVFKTENTLDARRALKLSQELGFQVQLAELKEGWLMENALIQANVPVFLSLKLPKEPKKEKEDSTATPATPITRTSDQAGIEAEAAWLKARQDSVRALMDGQAAQLHRAGLQFGFSTMEVKAKNIRANLRRMIAQGLSEEAALAALTTNAATLLGLDQAMGTVEAGKMANLVITDKPYFEEDSKIRYVFVAGQKFIFKDKKKSKKKEGDDDDESVFNPAGAWSYTLETPQGPVSGTITLTGDADDLSGTISNDQDNETKPIEEPSLDGNELTFSFPTDIGGQSITIDVHITFDGDDLEGTMDVGDFGSFPMEGSRTETPDFE